jgi:osmotically-inducible protein OsmY
MELKRTRIVSVMLLCGLANVLISVSYSRAQQGMSDNAPGAVTGAPTTTTDQSLTVEHDKVQTSAEHIYNSPAERANDDLLITEVKRSLAERGISDRYPVAVDCDHGTIQLSGVVASADEARRAGSIAMNTRGVVGVKNKLTWR